jgi:hypothetical protein
MKFKKTFLLLFIIPLLSFTAHKYYLSLTEIKYNPEEKAIQIILNVFIDDIEEALNKDYNLDLRLNTKKELKNNAVYFEKYLRDKLQFKVDGITKKFIYLGKEYDADSIYFYLEIENIDQLKTLELTNNLLLKHFSKQQNLIKCKLNDKNKTVLLTKDKNSAKFKY